jgi:hypothetical protein
MNAARRRCFVGVCAAFISLASFLEAHARAFEVRQLDPKNPEVWGTDEFQVTVSSDGAVRNVRVKGKEIIIQAIALYTEPMPPGAKDGIRRVQGEGFGKTGLTMEKPNPQTRQEEGSQIFEYDHVLATAEISEGRPLCRVHETLTITPTGEIWVAYDCEWLETVKWGVFCHILYFKEEMCKDRDYAIRVADRFYKGRLDKGPPADRQIVDLSFKQLTIQTEIGPVYFVWEGQTGTYFGWGAGNPQLLTGPSIAPGATFQKGQKERVAYRILLPVSLQ